MKLSVFKPFLLPLLTSLCLACTNTAIDQTIEQSENSTNNSFEKDSAIAIKQCPKRTVVPKLKSFYENTPDCGGENQPICHPLQQQSPCDRGFVAAAPQCEICIKDKRVQPKKRKQAQ